MHIITAERKCSKLQLGNHNNFFMQISKHDFAKRKKQDVLQTAHLLFYRANTYICV